MSIGFHGIGEVAATFKSAEGAELKVGDVITVTGNGEVGLGTAGDLPCGMILHVEDDGCACVQIGGLAEVGYSGDTAPAVGRAALSADGSGKVAADEENGMEFLVISVDETAETAVIKL